MVPVMFDRAKFYYDCPRTRAEFVTKFRNDPKFRNTAQVFGFNVIGDNVIFPTGRIADSNVK